jgi:hypothetical protein
VYLEKFVETFYDKENMLKELVMKHIDTLDCHELDIFLSCRTITPLDQSNFSSYFLHFQERLEQEWNNYLRDLNENEKKLQQLLHKLSF